MPWHETESLFQSTLRAAKDASPNEDNLKSLEVVDLGEAGRQEVWQSNSRSISKTIAKHGGTYSSWYLIPEGGRLQAARFAYCQMRSGCPTSV
jgi:hypothetical protein